MDCARCQKELSFQYGLSPVVSFPAFNEVTLMLKPSSYCSWNATRSVFKIKLPEGRKYSYIQLFLSSMACPPNPSWCFYLLFNVILRKRTYIIRVKKISYHSLPRSVNLEMGRGRYLKEENSFAFMAVLCSHNSIIIKAFHLHSMRLPIGIYYLNQCFSIGVILHIPPAPIWQWLETSLVVTTGRLLLAASG